MGKSPALSNHPNEHRHPKKPQCGGGSLFTPRSADRPGHTRASSPTTPAAASVDAAGGRRKVLLYPSSPFPFLSLSPLSQSRTGAGAGRKRKLGGVRCSVGMDGRSIVKFPTQTPSRPTPNQITTLPELARLCFFAPAPPITFPVPEISGCVACEPAMALSPPQSQTKQLVSRCDSRHPRISGIIAPGSRAHPTLCTLHVHEITCARSSVVRIKPVSVRTPTGIHDPAHPSIHFAPYIRRMSRAGLVLH